MPPPTPFRYAERLPHASLAPWIACYWEFTAREGAPPVHYVPPDGCTSLLIPTSGPHAGTLLYTGPWLEPHTVPVGPGARFVGVRLRPGGTAGVLHLSPAVLLNATYPAVHIGGPRGSELQRELSARIVGTGTMDDLATALDAFWMRQSHAFAAPDPLVSAAVNALVDSNGERGIANTARVVGCSERTLLRRFRVATGLTPKQFARIRRVLAAAWHAVDGEERWGRIAAAAGYADQPHLIHDVKALTGLRPEELS